MISGNCAVLFTPVFYFQILPLFIVDATNYFGRLGGKRGHSYAALETEIKDYYQESSKRTSVDKVEKLAIYGLREEKSFHR